MDTKDIHPLTEAMTEILINRISQYMVENNIHREYATIVLSQFLYDYENKSLVEATTNLMIEASSYRKHAERYLRLTIEEIEALARSGESRQARAWVEMSIVHSLVLEAVTELVASFPPNGRD